MTNWLATVIVVLRSYIFLVSSFSSIFIVSEQDQGNVRNISTIGAPHHHHHHHVQPSNAGRFNPEMDDSRHRLIHVKGVRKPCVCCRLHKNRTKSGWFIYSFYKCVGCDVPLCDSRKRNCFEMYHKLLYGNQSADGDSMTEMR